MEGNKRLGVAIFGLGRAGQIHIKNVVQNYKLELLYAIDLRLDHTKSLLEQYHQPQCQALSPADQDIALNDKKLDFVLVSTPTFEHEEIVLAAARAGKAIFCEKPIAATDEAIENCYNVAAENGVALFCSFNRRYDPSLRQMHKSRDQIGQIQMVKSCARDAPFPPMEYLKISGGVFHDCLVHDIDLICWMMGDYPVQVFASAHAFCEEIKAMNDVDTVAAVMKFKSGTVAVIDTSRDAVYGYDQRIELFGSKGMLLNQNQRPNNLVRESEQGMTSGRIYNSFNDRYEDSYIQALEHFCRVVRGEEEMEITKENTLNISKIADALERSSRTGQQIDMTY
ncbi:myo-inositol 2-dehydrogenase-like [Watersipora subatra]|uniref:myo-inositol 2-dehydrogenase-like n=1 Tax=Watersipora subatra TaxID=2589382 RepID=UPI00355BB4B5